MVQNGKCTQGEYRKSPSGPCPQPTAPPRGSFLEFVLEQTCKYAHTATHCSALCHVISTSCPSLLLEHAKHTLPQGLCTTVPSVLLLDIHTAPSLTFFGLGSKVTSLENSPARPLHPPLRARQVLSQLSYTPKNGGPSGTRTPDLPVMSRLL